MSGSLGSAISYVFSFGIWHQGRSPFTLNATQYNFIFYPSFCNFLQLATYVVVGIKITPLYILIRKRRGFCPKW